MRRSSSLPASPSIQSSGIESLPQQRAAAAPATQAVVWLDKGGAAANQRWTFLEAPEHFAYLGVVSSGTYAVKSALNNKVLDVYGASTEQNVAVKLWVKKNTDNANQVWLVSQDSRAYVHFESMHSALQLALRQNGAVQAKGQADWIVEPAGSGYFYLRDAKSDKVLTVESDGTTVSAAVQTGDKSQLWSFEATDVAFSSAFATGDTRIMGTIVTIGQATGTAAAIAVREKLSVREGGCALACHRIKILGSLHHLPVSLL